MIQGDGWDARLWVISLAIALLGAGCVPCVDDPQINTPAPVVDFVKAHRLAKTLFDVSFTTTITDEQLAATYQTDTNTVLVRSTTFPGDTSPSRYMYTKDSTLRTQAVFLSGTNSETLWKFDFDLASTYEPDFDSPVDRGFNNAALTVLDDLLPRLELDYPVAVSGYSIGGAMAVLLGQYLVLNGYEVSEVVTFGQPKITNAESGLNFVNLPLLRFVNRKDPVPHLPPNDLVPNETFDHFAPEVILYDGPYYSYLDESDPSYVRSTDGNLLSFIPQIDFNEHGILYVERLEAKLAEAIQIPYVCIAPKTW
jgi:triacylglycerol lipase